MIEKYCVLEYYMNLKDKPELFKIDPKTNEISKFTTMTTKGIKKVSLLKIPKNIFKKNEKNKTIKK